MGLNIKNHEVEELAAQIATATGETKTEAIRRALLDRRDRLGLPSMEAKIAELERTLKRLHDGRVFEPVSKEEWDALNE